MIRAALALVASLALPVTAQGAVPLGQPAATASSGRILVMPFENVKRDNRIVWLGEASAVLIADDLNEMGAGAITRDERREAFDRLQVPPAATLTDATVIRIGQLVGADQIVVGTVELDGDALVVHARTIALDVGRVRANVQEKGALEDLFAIYERVARQIAPTSAQPVPDPPRRQPALAAFEDYIKGLLAETPSTQINYLNAALARQPDLDRARIALWNVYADEGDHEDALEAVEPIASGSPLWRHARFLAGLSQLQLKRFDEAFATFKALSATAPTAAVLNNLGVVQLRRGATPQTGQATYYFNKAAELNPDDPDCFFNLGYAYFVDRDTQAAIYWLREAVRRDPADGDAHFVLGAALSAAGHVAEASREKELALRLSSTYQQWQKRPATDPVPRGLERIKSDVELPRASGVEKTLATSEQRNQQDLAAFYLERGRRLFEQENDREALVQLNHAIFLSPYQAEAHLLVGRIDLRNGRTRAAIDAFKISLWSDETADAHVALGEAYLQQKDLDAARVEAERALALAPGSTAARQLLQKAGAKPPAGAPPPRRGAR